MKNAVILGFFLLVFASCNKSSDEIPDREIGGRIYDLRLRIAIVDQALQDRLNPESPAYFGEVFTGGIEMLYMYNGKKFVRSDTWLMTNINVTFHEDYEGIQAPIRETVHYGPINQNTLGYYFLYADPPLIFMEDSHIYLYIRYPDGGEDEIKIQIYESNNGDMTRMDKIWINSELVYSMSEFYTLSYNGMWPDSVYPTYDSEIFLDYYNPKYYPYLVPVLDMEGRQVGQQVRPKNGTDVVFIMK